MAAVTAAGTTWNTTGGNTTVTATPAVGDLIVVIAGSTGTATTAVSDNNSSSAYTQVDSNRTGFSTTGTLNVWVRNSLITAATSTVFTATQTSSTGGGLTVLRISGMSTSGPTAVRSAGGQSTGTAASTPAPVLSNTPLTANVVIGAVANGTNAAGSIATPRTGYTEHTDSGYNTPATGLEVMSRDSGETSATITWGSTSASAFASVAIELDTSAPASATVDANQVRPQFETRLVRPSAKPLQLLGDAAVAGTAPTQVAETGIGGVGLAATGTARKVVAQGGSCGSGVTGSGVVRKVATIVGRAATGAAGTGNARKVQAHTGAAAVGTSGTGADKKAAVETGAAAVGLSATRSGTTARPQSGTGLIGSAGTGTPRKTATPTGTAAAGLAGTGTAKKVFPHTGLVAVGGGARSVDQKLARSAAAAPVGIAAVGAAGKRIAQLGAAGVALTATGYVSTWGPPPGLTATPISTTRIDLSWNPVAEASGYDIERNGVVVASDVVGTSYSDTGLTPSTTYTYRARSVHA